MEWLRMTTSGSARLRWHARVSSRWRSRRTIRMASVTASDGAARAPRAAPTALRLLRKLVATRWFELDAIARALVVSDARLAAYLAESEPIPLDRQLSLALFVIECVP